MHFFSKKFAYIKKKYYLCTRFQKGNHETQKKETPKKLLKMKTINFETPAQILERLEETVKNYRNILDGLKNVIQRHNWCVVDADFEAFAVRRDAKECLTFGDDADFYIKADAEEIAEKAVYTRKDGKRVNLKVMSERQFFEMKLRKTEEALQLFKQYAA